jgi:TorA maturation chaperone TorD
MVNNAVLLPDERSRVYWLLSDFFLKPPTELSSTIWQMLKIPEQSIDSMSLHKEFTRLFRGIQEGYGPPPPYESLYRPNEFPTDITEAVLSYFQTGGFDAAVICDEPPDFLASEFRLMSLLAFKEHECCQNEDWELSRFFINLQREFLQNHLLVWVPDYCQILSEASRVNCYQQLASYISVFLKDMLPNDSSGNQNRRA